MIERHTSEATNIYRDPELPLTKKDVDDLWYAAPATVPGICQACEYMAIARRRRADGKWTCRSCFG